VRAQRIDKTLTNAADARRFGSASGEYHLDIGARVGGRGGDGCDQKRPNGGHGGNETTEGIRLHIAILSRADNGRSATHLWKGSRRQSSFVLRSSARDVSGIAAQSG
jgi:hypothetical protein